MIKDCLFTLSNTPEDLKEIIRNSSAVCSFGVSCNIVNKRYINILGISDYNVEKHNDKYSLEEIITNLKPVNLFEIALCLKLYNDFLFNRYDYITMYGELIVLKQVLYSKNKRRNKYKLLMPLLKDSRGWLVWKYQLYNILSLAIDSAEDIKKYMKGLNSKKEEVIEEIRKFKIDNFYLYDAIKDLSHPTSGLLFYSPNLRDALILNNELQLF